MGNKRCENCKFDRKMIGIYFRNEIFLIALKRNVTGYILVCSAKECKAQTIDDINTKP